MSNYKIRVYSCTSVHCSIFFPTVISINIVGFSRWEESAKNGAKRLRGGVIGTNIFGVLGALTFFPLKAWH